jgi:uncharacterized protein YbjT (DUF2867 family)
MGRTVFITGSGGFVGQSVLAELRHRGHRVRALVRSKSDSPADPDVQSFSGDITRPKTLDEPLRGCDAAIHLVGIIDEKPGRGVTFPAIHVEGTRNVVEAAKAKGVRRLVHMSALGTRPDAVSDYHKTKWEAEQIVRASGLDWTILRPSMIHGPRGEFTRQAAAWAKKQAMPFVAMPYFGSGLLGRGGAGQLQPVYVQDVARAFVDALENPRTSGRTYDLVGPEHYTWPRFYQAIATAVVGRPRATLPIPAWYARLLTRLVPRSLLPFNRDQVLMSQEDNTGNIAPFVADFGWTPRALEPTLSEYAAQLR